MTDVWPVVELTASIAHIEMSATAVCAVTHSDCYWRPVYERLLFNSWADSLHYSYVSLAWASLTNCRLAVFYSQLGWQLTPLVDMPSLRATDERFVSGSRSDCERLMICSWDDSWLCVCTYPMCFMCELCVCEYWLPFDMIADTVYKWSHSDYYRRADCDRSLIRSWYERWHCLCDCPYWLLCTSDLWVTPDYYLSWQLTLLVCINVLIATDRWFAPRGVDKYAVSGAWSCCALTCGEGESSLISCPLLNCCEHMERSYLTDDSMLNRLVDVIRDSWVFQFALGKRSSGRHDR